MTLIGNKFNFIDDEDEQQEEQKNVIPAVIRKNEEGITFEHSVFWSAVLHPATIALAMLIILILNILGVTFPIFQKPDLAKKDIEFVLVDHEAMPRNPNTRNRADMNSRSGGKNDPKKPVSLPSASKSKPSKASAASSDLQKMIKKQQKQIQKQQTQTIKQQRTQQQTAPKQHQQASQAPRPSVQRPAPPTVAPSAHPVSAPPKVAIKPSTPFSVPVPSGLPAGKTLSTGPVGGTSSASGSKHSGGYSGGGSTAGRYAPAPSLAPSGGGGSNQLARGGGGTGGNVGNPGGGGGRPGIDAIKEPDFGPYMRELQRRIKLNWNPPKGNESKRVVLLFKIAKSGRMLSCRVLKSSGLPAADQAALRAVELTAPFRPLPAEFRGQSIDIQFTFDYNVFGANRY